MGAVAWGALLSAIALVVLAARLALWRRHQSPSSDQIVDLVGAETSQRVEDLAFDAIIGNLLRSDPAFADSTDRLSRQDDSGSAT